IAWHDGRYKLYSSDQGKHWELYDLQTDPNESNDLAATKPEVVQQMAADVSVWQASCKESDKEHDYK
ncbi:MAG: N-acetylgalactosamine 6-sulfate sulfatase, partial [Rubripirellula sp.]